MLLLLAEPELAGEPLVGIDPDPNGNPLPLELDPTPSDDIEAPDEGSGFPPLLDPDGEPEPPLPPELGLEPPLPPGLPPEGGCDAPDPLPALPLLPGGAEPLPGGSYPH